MIYITRQMGSVSDSLSPGALFWSKSKMVNSRQNKCRYMSEKDHGDWTFVEESYKAKPMINLAQLWMNNLESELKSLWRN